MQPRKLTLLPYAYSQFAQVSIGVIHETVALSSAMVEKAVAFSVSQSLPK